VPEELVTVGPAAYGSVDLRTTRWEAGTRQGNRTDTTSAAGLSSVPTEGVCRRADPRHQRSGRAARRRSSEQEHAIPTRRSGPAIGLPPPGGLRGRERRGTALPRSHVSPDRFGEDLGAWSCSDVSRPLVRDGVADPGPEPQGIDSDQPGATRLWLSAIAYNLGNLWRRLGLPKRIDTWSLTSLQQRPMKTGGRLVKHARFYWLLLAEGHLTRRLFGAIVQRLTTLSVPAG